MTNVCACNIFSKPVTPDNLPEKEHEYTNPSLTIAGLDKLGSYDVSLFITEDDGSVYVPEHVTLDMVYAKIYEILGKYEFDNDWERDCVVADILLLNGKYMDERDLKYVMEDYLINAPLAYFDLIDDYYKIDETNPDNLGNSIYDMKEFLIDKKLVKQVGEFEKVLKQGGDNEDFYSNIKDELEIINKSDNPDVYKYPSFALIKYAMDFDYVPDDLKTYACESLADLIGVGLEYEPTYTLDDLADQNTFAEKYVSVHDSNNEYVVSDEYYALLESQESFDEEDNSDDIGRICMIVTDVVSDPYRFETYYYTQDGKIYYYDFSNDTSATELDVMNVERFGGGQAFSQDEMNEINLLIDVIEDAKVAKYEYAEDMGGSNLYIVKYDENDNPYTILIGGVGDTIEIPEDENAMILARKFGIKKEYADGCDRIYPER